MILFDSDQDVVVPHFVDGDEGTGQAFSDDLYDFNLLHSHKPAAETQRHGEKSQLTRALLITLLRAFLFPLKFRCVPVNELK